jgi:hypothetical protein
MVMAPPCSIDVPRRRAPDLAHFAVARRAERANLANAASRSVRRSFEAYGDRSARRKDVGAVDARVAARAPDGRQAFLERRTVPRRRQPHPSIARARGHLR